MIEEKKFEYEDDIQRRLREIDDLDERRFAQKLLLENLGKLFSWTESKYEALERRILNELEIPWKRFNIFMTVIKGSDYDPIHGFWFPVCSDDLPPVQNRKCMTIYLAADEEKCRDFLDQGTLLGTEKESGQAVHFRVVKAERYQERIRKLYQLFVSNHIPWQTVHMGHLERFFDLIPMEDAGENADSAFDWGKWGVCIKEGMIPLWNIEKTMIHSREFRMPCIDEVFYEHICYLPEENENGDGYLVETEENLLSINYEKNRILLKTEEESIEEILLYRLHQKRRKDALGYCYPVLSNYKKDTLTARYLQQTGNFLQTEMELYRKIEEMSDSYRIKLLGYEITDRVEGKAVSGDMNEFTGTRIFSGDQRKILLLRIGRKEQQDADYLYESQVRYILTQLQMEFLEYRCMGVFV